MPELNICSTQVENEELFICHHQAFQDSMKVALVFTVKYRLWPSLQKDEIDKFYRSYSKGFQSTFLVDSKSAIGKSLCMHNIRERIVRHNTLCVDFSAVPNSIKYIIYFWIPVTIKYEFKNRRRGLTRILREQINTIKMI